MSSPAPTDATQTLKERMAAVKQLAALFRAERIVHLVVTTVSLIMLLTSACIMIVRSQADPTALTLMFGSSGLITYSANRLLRMWDQALQLLTGNRSGEGN